MAHALLEFSPIHVRIIKHAKCDWNGIHACVVKQLPTPPEKLDSVDSVHWLRHSNELFGNVLPRTDIRDESVDDLAHQKLVSVKHHGQAERLKLR